MIVANAVLKSKERLVDLVIHRQSARRMAGPIMLIIRDGWGINPGGADKRKENGDATLLASTPFHDKLYRDYPGSKFVLVAAIPPGPKLFPWLRREKVRESFCRKYHRLVWLSITISGGNQSHQEPHRQKRD